MDKLEVISVNVRGLNTVEKRIKVYDKLCDTKVDIIFLQVWRILSLFFSDSSFSRGVSVLFRKKSTC